MGQGFLRDVGKYPLHGIAYSHLHDIIIDSVIPSALPFIIFNQVILEVPFILIDKIQLLVLTASVDGVLVLEDPTGKVQL